MISYRYVLEHTVASISSLRDKHADTIDRLNYHMIILATEVFPAQGKVWGGNMMAINFISNDPAVPGASPKKITPTPNRPATKASFQVNPLPAEGVYAIDTVDFVAWQAREAALRALITFEAIAGPLVGWTGKASKKKLKLFPNQGDELNAYYDQDSVSFFGSAVGNKVVYSGASTDVVSHEVGHAILDALRPDLWNVSMMEVGAFHEGFGDCIAVMTALSDRDTRIAILQGNASLAKANFAEAWAEQLSAAIGKVEPGHNASKPRRALNKFKWAFPQTLPMDGKPKVLINEIHSFGQLASGCYYDLIGEIFRAGPGGQAGLWKACQTATKLLALAVKDAQVKPRFLEAVGRAMILVDRRQGTDSTGAGKNETHIKKAFEQHGIKLSVATFFAPRVTLAAGKPGAVGSRAGAAARKAPAKGKAVTLSPTAKREIRSIFSVETGMKLQAKPFSLGKSGSTEVTGYRPVDLSGLSKHLKNVKAYTPQVAIVGRTAGATAVLGSVDPGASVSAEVRDFVATLVQRNLIEYREKSRKGRTPKRSKSKRASGAVASEKRPTHALKRRGKEVVLERVRFGCQCHRISD